MMRRQIISVLLFFILLTIFFTFPLILNMNSYIPGFYSTDEPFGALWHFWLIKYSYLNKLDISSINLIAIPFKHTVGSGNMYWHLLNKVLILITNPVFTYTIQIVTSFILAGVIAYFLTFYLSYNNLGAFFSGLIFTFCPYHYIRSWQHLGLAHIQWIPLCLLLFFNLYRVKKFSNILLIALSISLIISFDLYYAYFMLITLILATCYISLFRKDNLKGKIHFVGMLFLAGIIGLILVISDLYSSLINIYQLKEMGRSYGVFGYIRPFEDLFEQSARPLSYFLPAVVHPVFGEFTKRFVGSGIYGVSVTEHTLYLGWTPLFLAFYAMRQWKRKRKLQITNYKLQTNSKFQIPNSKLRTNEDFYIGFFVLLAIVAWFFSQPPWWKIGPLKIYMPSFFMYKILPMFRAYCRFGIVVMLAVSVLAGFGLKFILERFKSQKTKITITAIFCGLVLFEFWNYPPFKVIDVSKVPAVYYWIKEQHKDIVIAEYPLDADTPSEMYKFYQTTHEKRIINATPVFSYANKVAKTITKLSNPNTAGVLKWMGVKYVVVHKEDYLNTELIEWIEELENIPKNPGLKFVRNFPSQDCPTKNIMCLQKTGPIDVYEVVATPTQPEIKNSEN